MHGLQLMQCWVFCLQRGRYSLGQKHSSFIGITSTRSAFAGEDTLILTDFGIAAQVVDVL